ncbi:MAG: O-methyltransferase family [Geobacteraceae bacterium]|nr:MAG: O-methyltransferase family [Geobacteraceae bacterium]
MNRNGSAGVKRPRSDDRALWDIVMGIYGYQAVLLCHELKLFPFLAGEPRTLQEIADAMNIASRPARALLQVCVALKLVQAQQGCYSLTAVAADYLLEDSPVYFGGFLDYTLAHRAVLSYDALKSAVLTDSSQVYGSAGLYESHEERKELARAFTRMMHSHSVAPALAWPKQIDLSGHRTMLDIGGGSGVHSIGAALCWPGLQAIVLDFPSVCEVAEEYLARHDLRNRIRTHTGNMWQDPFPPADVHFYADIFHDFPPGKCRYLAGKSFASLESGGLVIIHEMLYNSDKTGPFTVAGYDVSMLLWTEGQQFSGGELSAMLAEAGFVDIAVTATLGYWHIVTGIKP